MEQLDLFDTLRVLYQAGYRGSVLLSCGKTPESVRVELHEEGRGPHQALRLLQDRAGILRSRATGAV